MKYPDGYEVAYAMKYALRHIKDLLYFIFINDKYFIIEDYFILRSNISLFIPYKLQFVCHSEHSEESLQQLTYQPAEILRHFVPQNDNAGVEACHYAIAFCILHFPDKLQIILLFVSIRNHSSFVYKGYKLYLILLSVYILRVF